MTFDFSSRDGLAVGIRCDGLGWLAAYDPDAGDPAVPYPTGVATWTEDPDAALRFTSAASALMFWSQRSTRTPTRPDGLPNRPLTGTTIAVEPLPPLPLIH